jgi:hypothetical protein
LNVARPFAPIPRVKFAASLLLLSAALLSLPACTTLANRRELYSPKRGSGYWTERHADYRRGEGIFGISNPHHHPVGREEGIFGVSRNDDEVDFRASGHSEEGIFGVSRNRR